MKKHKNLLIIPLFILVLLVGYFLGRKDNQYYIEKETQVKSAKKELSMMLETGSNTGQYEQTTRSSWPTEGYLFNTQLSKCENGSKLKWDDESSTVLMSGNTSDKCYVYFDVYSPAVINSLTEEITHNSIKVTVNATQGTKAITKYYYSSNNGSSYTESASNTYIFTGLSSDTTYNIKIYAVDEKGKSSAVYSKSIKTDKLTLTLANYIKSQYTSQGANGIYLHNSSLANSANDGSYRYAGSNPNNYVCFGSDASTCPTDNLYRIIGVFGDQVKLIKADYATSTQLGTDGAYNSNTYSASSYAKYQTRGNLTTINRYYWTSSSNSSNVWSGSALNTTNLNSKYLSYLGTTWTNKIATTTWKVGGNTWTNIAESPMNTAYQNEIVSPAEKTAYSAKIGLMYVSDYGYAASPTYWTYKGNDTATTDYRAAINANWMYMGLFEWTISRGSGDSDRAFYVVSDGNVGNYIVRYNFAVRPVFYLGSSVNYVSGSGKASDPIRLN